MLRVLLPQFDQVIFTRYWENPRGVAAEELAAIASEMSPVAPHVCPDPATAWSLASQLASPQHLICITGSIFTAAQMRAAIREASG